MKAREAKRVIEVKLPKGRVGYAIDLPDNSELLISCKEGFEICAGRISSVEYRIWTRKASTARRGPGPINYEADPRWEDPCEMSDDTPSGGPL